MLAAIAQRGAARLPALRALPSRSATSPPAATEPGISALPDGAKYYQFLIRRTTTTDLTADQIHQIGLDEVKQDEAEMLVIAQKLGFKDLPSFRASLKTNPKLHPASAEALLDAYRGYLTPCRPSCRSSSAACPRPRLKWLAVPDYLEKNFAARLLRARHARRQPPRPSLRINTYNATDRNLYAVEAIAYHEGLPGHHLQISIAQETDRTFPTFRKYEHYTAYTEGWGLYSERLGKDVGFYQDPYSDYGRLEADIWRAIRLVVDTGVHSQHWTRQQMVDYFHDHSSHRRDQQSSPRSTATSHGPARPSPTRSASSKSSNCATAPKRLSATSSISAPSTTRCSTPALCRSMS